MRKRLMLTVSVAVLICVFAPVSRAWYPYSEKYTNWQEDRPMMMAALHNCVPTDQMADRIARFKAAGLNTFVWLKPGNAHSWFRAAHEGGLSWGGGYRGGIPVAAEALKIPGCAYYMTADEPGGRTPEDFAEIAELAEWLRENHPDVPQYVQFSITKADHDVVIETTKPDIFSFDAYPLLANGATGEYYLYSVMWGRQTAQRHKLPYWMWLQAYGIEEDNPNPIYSKRVPDEADIRFLVFTLLAHGGTGIQFFIYYGLGESMVDDLDVVRPGSEPAANHHYERTVMSRSWFAVRDVAPEVQVLARALLNLRSKDPVAYWPLPHGHDNPWGSIGPAEPLSLTAFAGEGNLRSMEVVDGEDMGLLVGFFDDEAGEEYFMVVNLAHGTNMSKCDGARMVRLTFGAGVEQIERLNRLTGLVETLRTSVTGDDIRTLDIQLEGGTGDLFKWANGTPWALRPAP